MTYQVRGKDGAAAVELRRSVAKRHMRYMSLFAACKYKFPGRSSRYNHLSCLRLCESGPCPAPLGICCNPGRRLRNGPPPPGSHLPRRVSVIRPGTADIATAGPLRSEFEPDLANQGMGIVPVAEFAAIGDGRLEAAGLHQGERCTDNQSVLRHVLARNGKGIPRCSGK